MAFRRVREANQSIGLKRCCDFVVLSRLNVGSCICLIHSDFSGMEVMQLFFRSRNYAVGHLSIKKNPIVF